MHIYLTVCIPVCHTGSFPTQTVLQFCDSKILTRVCLADEEYQQTVAEAVKEGITKYIEDVR